MTMIDIPRMQVIPDFAMTTSADLELEFFSSGAAAAAIVALAPGETVYEIGITKKTATGTTNVTVGVEDVSTTAQASPLVLTGTYLGGGTAKSENFNAFALPAGMSWIALGTPYTNTTGQTQLVALTIRYTGSGGDFSAGARFTSFIGIGSQRKNGFPSVTSRGSGTGAFGTISGVGFPLIAARNSSGVLVGGTLAAYRSSVETALAGGTYFGNKWTVGFGCRLCAATLVFTPGDEDEDIRVRTYINGTLVDNVRLYENQYSSLAVADLTSEVHVTVPLTQTSLNTGDVVRIVVEGLGPSGVSLPEMTYSSSADRLASLNQSDIQKCASDDGVVWADSPTRLCSVSPVIDQIRTGSGVRRFQFMTRDGRMASVR